MNEACHAIDCLHQQIRPNGMVVLCAQGLPKRKQQHPWLSKRGVHLRGAQQPPHSRRSASVPRAASERMGSPSRTASAPRAAVQPSDRPQPLSPISAGSDKDSSGIHLQPVRPSSEVLDAWQRPTQYPASTLAQDIGGQQHPSESQIRAESAQSPNGLLPMGAWPPALATQQRNTSHESLNVQGQAPWVQRSQHVPELRQAESDNPAQPVHPVDVLGSGVSVEPLLAQLEDMEARMQAMMSTIASKLHSIQGTHQ